LKPKGIKWDKAHQLELHYHELICSENDAIKRMKLYKEFYNNLFELYKITNPKKLTFGYVRGMMKNYYKWMKGKVVLDFGCGYGISTIEISKYSKFVYGIEANSVVIEKAKKLSPNINNIDFKVINNMEIPLPDNSIDFIFCFDVVEHLYPDDFLTHLKSSKRVLVPGGTYFCLTPNNLFGPFDSTRFYKPHAKSEGGHIKEYTYSELISIFRKQGFSNIRSSIILDRLCSKIFWYIYPYLLIPASIKIAMEKLSKIILANKLIGYVLGITYVSLISSNEK